MGFIKWGWINDSLVPGEDVGSEVGLGLGMLGIPAVDTKLLHPPHSSCN